MKILVEVVGRIYSFVLFFLIKKNETPYADGNDSTENW